LCFVIILFDVVLPVLMAVAFIQMLAKVSSSYFPAWVIDPTSPVPDWEQLNITNRLTNVFIVGMSLHCGDAFSETALLDSDASVQEAVNSIPGAIGYVSNSETVQVVVLCVGVAKSPLAFQTNYVHFIRGPNSINASSANIAACMNDASGIVVGLNCDCSGLTRAQVVDPEEGVYDLANSRASMCWPFSEMLYRCHMRPVIRY
jgi:hypothetical protein